MSAILESVLDSARLRDAIENDRKAGYVTHIDVLAGKVQPFPQIFKARFGRKRAYFSQEAADLYDGGYRNWPSMPLRSPSPEFDGYFDRDERECGHE